MTKEVINKIFLVVKETEQAINFEMTTGKAVFVWFKYPEVVELPGIFKFDGNKAVLDENAEENKQLIEVIKAIKKVRETADDPVPDSERMVASYNKALKLVEIMEKYSAELYREARKVLEALEKQEQGKGVIVPRELQIKVTFNKTEENIF